MRARLMESRSDFTSVGGLALPAATAKLGISPNTARTHLNRIFERTGVGGQARWCAAC
jgi:hypothetical protein